MEKELKITLSVFLFYLIFGLTQLFKTQALITPVFLTSYLLIACSVLFLFMNLKTAGAYLLVLMCLATILLASADPFVAGALHAGLGERFYTFFTSTSFTITCVLIFYAILFYFVSFYYLKTRNKTQAIILLTAWGGSFILLFNPNMLLYKISLELFSLLFFYFGQQGSDMKDKALRVVSYQFLLLPLLQSFEYFL